MTGALRTVAPAKLNACLYLGPARDDGRHELVTVFEPLELADVVTLEPAAGDEVVCQGVEGPNLAAAALRAFRERTGWDEPVRLTIEKRIPVAAGMAGGSADAAAALRLAAAAAGVDDRDLLLELAAGLGADVPAAVLGERCLGTGAGEVVRALPARAPRGVLVLPAAEGLGTPDVFREADRMGLGRDADALALALAAVEEALAAGQDVPPVNELEPAAVALCPAIEESLAAGRSTGARQVLLSGSGPTVVALFADPAGAGRAARSLAGRRPAPIATRTRDEPPVLEGVAALRHNERRR